MNQTIIENIKHYIPEEHIRFDEPMNQHTTFRVGGSAKVFITVEKEEELAGLVPYLCAIGVPFFVLGNGSNLLVSDKGYDGVIIALSDSFQKVVVMGDEIVAQAGAKLGAIARKALEYSLTGFEFAAGIPGSLGGAVVMNAGAYDGEMKQIMKSVHVMAMDGSIMDLSNTDMEFGYRTSVLKKEKFIVLSAVISLKKGDQAAIRNLMDDLAARRREKQPLEYPSAGSTFKRPEGYFAGKLIMDAGLRGYRVGGAQVSEKHCGFVINRGNASADDINDVILHVQEVVKEKYHVTLETEVIRIGTF